MRILIYLTHKSVDCWNADEGHAARLRNELGAEVTLARSSEAFRAALPEAEVVITWVFKQEWFALASKLRILATPAAGRDYLNVDAPPHVRKLYGSWHGRIMGETALGMMLGCARGLFRAQMLQREEAWPRETLSKTQRLLAGSHLVILGFGQIGGWVGKLAKPLGVRVTGVRRNAHAPTPEWFDACDRVVGVDELDAVLPRADHLFLALPGEQGTDQLLDRRRLALLPPHAYVYNIGRGNAIDEAALVDALTAGRLAGACLDVFQEEPLPADSPLRTCPNCVVMPHASAVAPEYLDFFLDEFIPACRQALA